MSIVFVPGTGGTKLLKDGATLGHPVVINGKLWLLNTFGVTAEGIVRDMSMKHVPDQLAPVETTLTEGSHVVSGGALEAAYNQILLKVDDVFTYDWRGCIEHSATRLLADLEQRSASGTSKLVGHSQGGLVIIAASKLFKKAHPRRRFSSLVSHIAFVGTPVYGTLNAAHALLVGEDLGAAASPEFRRVAATWPALYQMLPAWNALQKLDGSASPYSFFHKAAYRKYPWIDPELVSRAWHVRSRLFKHPVTEFHGIHYRFWFAQNRKTWSHATRNGDGTIIFGAKNAVGDSLVPYQRTYDQMSDVERQHVDVVGPNENNPEHSMLLTGDWIATQVIGGLDD